MQKLSQIYLMEDLIVSYVNLLIVLPATLLVGLTGIKLYSWGRQTLLEKESSESVQKS